MDYFRFWEKLSHQFSAQCERFDDIFLRRKCRIDTKQILSGVINLKSSSSQSYQTIFKEHPKPIAASTFCDARRKIPASAFDEVRQEQLELWDELSDEKSRLYKGYELYACDGSTLNLPRELAIEGFKIAKDNYLPQGLLSILFRLSDRKISALDFASSRCERSAASRLTENLSTKSIVIGDKGYLSYGTLCEFAAKNIKILFSVPEGQLNKEIAGFLKSNLDEDIVTIFPSEEARSRAKKLFPDAPRRPQTVRLIRGEYENKTQVLVTTIFDESFTRAEIVELYRLRWRIEELFKSLKEYLKIEEFHSKNANGIEQELHAAAILWNQSSMLSAFLPETHFKKSI